MDSTAHISDTCGGVGVVCAGLWIQGGKDKREREEKGERESRKERHTYCVFEAVIQLVCEERFR